MQVSHELNEGVALVAFDDGKKNAVTPQGAADILAALDEAEAAAEAMGSSLVA